MTSTPAAAGAPVDRATALAHLLAGRAGTAAVALRSLVEAEPHAPNLRYDLGAALYASGERAAAADTWSAARAMHGLALLRELGVDMDRFAADADYAAETGRGLMANGLPGVAAVALARTLEATGPQAQILAEYAVCLLHQGALEEACEVLGMAGPHDVASLHPLLMAAYAFFDDDGLRRSLLARQAATGIEDAARPVDMQASAAGAADRPLKVGYVAGASALDPRFLAVIARHDPEAVQSALLVEDEAGAPEGFTAFSLGGLSDDEAADAVAAFGFDLLVDLSGPAGGRMGLFARRPAPAQASWSSDLATSGLRAIDAKLLPRDCIELDASMLFTETLVPMGPVLAPWPQVAVAPRSADGRFVVGAFMAPALLGHDVIAALSRVALEADAGLMLKHPVMDDPVIQRVIAARFLAHGVPRDRLDFRGAAGPELDQLDFDGADLAIDSRPSMGEAQLLSLLSRGVPVLCAGGPTTRGRLNVAPLQALGLRELIVDDLNAAAARAIALAGDRDAVAAIRARIDNAFASSAYGDSAKVARDLEAAFQEIVGRRSRQAASLKDLLSRVI
jgi:hypothetical protein